ncbi:MAG: 2-oxo acid dehydrogenase subunit E2, partial [Firmicutes bacterium]|nr:2-oxo acid dehydrogenase subunit E2 [Bacillota bacterium]
MAEVRMPKLGESVTEGTIGRWLKAVGERVEKYEPLAEIVTDKVTAELPSDFSGTLTDIVIGEGETVAVGVVLGHITEEGGPSSRPAETGVSPAAPAARDAQTAPPAASAARDAQAAAPAASAAPSG